MLRKNARVDPSRPRQKEEKGDGNSINLKGEREKRKKKF
jgi:hypothetical protein